MLCIISFPMAFAESTNVGKVYWTQEIVSQNSFADIVIEDDDMNKKEYPNFADKLTIHVWSDSSPDGFDVVAVENGIYTGIFRASVYISDTDSAGVKLYSKNGDVLYAKYVDTTVSGSPMDIVSASVVKIPGQDMTQYLDKIDPQFLQKQNKIPGWIKNNAGWWADGTISESEFIQGIQFLIKDGIIVIPPTAVSAEKSQSVPGWIKNNAGWWADGTISDDQFLKGVQFLIGRGIISIGNTSTQSSDSSFAECNSIISSYDRLNCEREEKRKLEEIQYNNLSDKFQAGPAAFYYPGIGNLGNEFTASQSGQTMLRLRLMVENTGSENLSMMCSKPSICNYDIWNGEKAFKSSTNDFVSGKINIKPGKSYVFNMMFGPNIGYGGTTFEYDSTKEYFFRVSEPWGSLMIPLNLSLK